MKPFIVVGILLALAPIVLADSVGFSRYNATVWQFWNSGPVENATYITTNMQQIANRPERFGWGNYRDCVFAFNGPSMTKVCVDDIGLMGSPDSDNATYWSYGGKKTTQLGSVGKIFSQNLGDRFVNRTVTWNANVNQPLDYWLGFCIKDINVDLDNDADTIDFEADGMQYGFAANDASMNGFTSLNVTSSSVKVGDLQSDSAIEWQYTNTEKGVSWNNGELCVLEHVGRGPLQGPKQVSYQWIDSPACIVGTVSGCGFQSITAVGGGNSVDAHVPFYGSVVYGCKQIMGCGSNPVIPQMQSCNNRTSWGLGCYVGGYMKASDGLYHEVSTDDTLNLSCEGYSYPDCRFSNLSVLGGNSSNGNFLCWNINTYSAILCYQTESGGCYPNMTGSETTSSHNFTVQCNEIIVNESEGRRAIDEAFSASDVASSWTDKQIYIKTADVDNLGLWDKVAHILSQFWSINYITKGESFQNGTNMTPSLYQVEYRHMSYDQLMRTVEGLISATKS